jgi:hypothetical protein
MKFDIYGCFFIEVIRESGNWVVYRIDQGRRLKLVDPVIPADSPADDIPRWLEDFLHESALPGRKIKLIK